MTNPWDPDHGLSLEQATALVGHSFDQVNPDGLRLLGSGWEFDAYLSSDGWVVRFPRRVETADLFAQERRVHQLIERHLPRSCAIPRVEFLADPAPGFPYPFAAHRYIPGNPADDVGSGLLQVTAREIGALLGAIHSIDEAEARSSGVNEVARNVHGERHWFETGLAALGELRSSDSIVNRSADWVECAIDELPHYAGPLRFVHQDLSPEHVLVDPATGRVTGILDWTDVILGDAARDFVFLVAWRGWPFVEEVLRSYPPPLDPGFRDRLRFMARLLTPVWLGMAILRGTEVEKMKSWVHNAFAPELHTIQLRDGGLA
jgi:aminoglycoside phosphotransferase (APT) family kinase protein